MVWALSNTASYYDANFEQGFVHEEALYEETLRELDDDYDTQSIRHGDATLISLYAAVVFTSLFFLSGIIVMFSDDLPVWVSEAFFPKPAVVYAIDTLP